MRVRYAPREPGHFVQLEACYQCQLLAQADRLLANRMLALRLEGATWTEVLRELQPRRVLEVVGN